MPRSGSICDACGADQNLLARPVAPPPPPGHRSATVAVLLSFIWLGAGHVYAGRSDIGAALMGYNTLLLIMSVPVITLIFTVPMWLVSAPVVAVLAARNVVENNGRVTAVTGT
jgi:hypothetical protein